MFLHYRPNRTGLVTSRSTDTVLSTPIPFSHYWTRPCRTVLAWFHQGPWMASSSLCSTVWVRYRGETAQRCWRTSWTFKRREQVWRWLVLVAFIVKRKEAIAFNNHPNTDHNLHIYWTCLTLFLFTVCRYFVHIFNYFTIFFTLRY